MRFCWTRRQDTSSTPSIFPIARQFLPPFPSLLLLPAMAAEALLRFGIVLLWLSWICEGHYRSASQIAAARARDFGQFSSIRVCL